MTPLLPRKPVDVVRFLGTGIVSSLFCWKNVTRTFYACIILSNPPLEKCLPVHNKRDGVQNNPPVFSKNPAYQNQAGFFYGSGNML